jgi:hypothetical protein
MDSAASTAYRFVWEYRWWLAALSPIVIILVVLKLLNPN